MRIVATAHPGEFAQLSSPNPTYQAYQILHWALANAPLIAGIDKFFNKLTDTGDKRCNHEPPVENLVSHWGFVIAPLIAGVDKFFNKLTDWSMYLWAPLGKMFGG